MTPQETDPDLPVSVQESPAEAWVTVACCRAGATECGSACMGPFEGGHHYLLYLHHSLASGQTTGREHSPAHQQKIGLKIKAQPRPSEQDPVSPTVSVSHQETPISLLSLPVRASYPYLQSKTNQAENTDHNFV